MRIEEAEIRWLTPMVVGRLFAVGLSSVTMACWLYLGWRAW